MKISQADKANFKQTLTSLILLALLGCSAITVWAQGTTPQRGFTPAASYALSDLETVNTANGNVMLNLPLASLPAGRGGLGANVNLLYSSKLWDTPPVQVPDPNNPNNPITRYYLKNSPQGGWRYGVEYKLQLINKLDEYMYSNFKPNCETDAAAGTEYASRIWKLQMIFPDGSVHEFIPQGYQSAYYTYGDGYYKIHPEGWLKNCVCTRVFDGFQCTQPTYMVTSDTMTYYSTDGTYMRLDIPHNTSTNMTNKAWTLYLPDGGRITGNGVTDTSGTSGVTGPQRIYDRNNNYIEIQRTTLNNHPATKLIDQLNRSITIEYGAAANQDNIYATGFNGQPLQWAVKWKTIYVNKTSHTDQYSSTDTQKVNQGLTVVDQVILPSQAGNLAYTFNYNGAATSNYPNGGTGNPSVGWGEISSITLPSGAQASYLYQQDNVATARWYQVLQNSPTRKDLTYLREYDGASTSTTESWLYSFSFVSTNGSSTLTQVTAPDGSVTTDYIKYSTYSPPEFDHALSYRTDRPDGTIVERRWQQNIPSGGCYGGCNSYIKTEYSSIKNAAGTPVKTAISDYNYDKNGNVTRVADYDWVDYSSVHDAYGNPTWTLPGAALKKVVVNTYHSATPDASDSTTANGNIYSTSSSPQLRNAIASSETSNASQTFVRTEFVYDNATTTGNLTQLKSWDSTKGAYSNPLATSNSVSISHQYDAYGNRILSVDAKGYQTQWNYGYVGPYTNLYPTETRTALGTAVQRYMTQEYDLYTGLGTLTTDVDNNVSTRISYDALGRPTLVKSAEGKTEETRTSTEYADTLRRIITRADLNVLGDGKLVSVQHYDQLGRVRLSRTLESSATEDPTNEAHGLKVQARYAYSGANSYNLVSNPYRAATSTLASAEPTMGWTRSKLDGGGRTIEVGTFAGSSLPAPWGSNTSGAGAATTAYDANYTTVTDAAGKSRRTVTDGLGRLSQVIEAPSGVAYQTDYIYDALGNLRQVQQGTQPARYFMYDSLSRLIRTKTPEQSANPTLALTDPASGNSQWSIGYVYDDNGNLTNRTDARGVTSTYAYDGLNRNTQVNYSDGTSITRYWDGAVNGRGRFWHDYAYSQGNTRIEHTAIDNYDSLGRAKNLRRHFYTGGVWSLPYTTQRNYDLTGHVISQSYPSGRTVSYTYDGAGRTNGFTGNLGDGVARTYAADIQYDALNSLSRERFGTDTPLYHKEHRNARGQLYDVRLSTVNDDLNWNRGAIVNYYTFQPYGFGTNGPDNNGNLLVQQNWIPTDDAISGYSFMQQNYDYDALNRLTWVGEYQNGATQTGAQSYSYDRYGNRTLSGWGAGINNQQFTVNANTNQLGVPSGMSGVMQYDFSGNLINDTYSGVGSRTYDAENRMVTATNNSSQQSLYTYDGDGRRSRRNTFNQETWQVYGLEGELVAEYAANAAPSSPQKEYGYRSGQLLVVAQSSTASAVSDFSATQNNGTWKYGSKTISGSTFTAFPSNANLFGGGLDSWSPGYCCPMITRNATGTTYTYPGAPSVVQPADVLNLHPGPTGDKAVVRWTAPAAGTYTISGRFQGIDTAGTTSDVTILHNTTSIFSSNVTGYGNQVTFSVTRTVAAGDTIDFQVGYGSNNSYGSDSTGLSATITPQGGGTNLQWLVADQVGTPRMIADKSGSLAGIRRHDYLPFGEELYAGTGGRTTQQGYVFDDVRQKFTQYERDIETGLDFAQARMYAYTQGRFTSPDPYKIVVEVQYETNEEKARTMLNRYISEPQQWNQYAYAINNPLKYTDSTGEKITLTGTAEEQQAALQRIKNILGNERFALVSQQTVDGNIVLSLSRENISKFASIGDDQENKDFSHGMAGILAHSWTVEFKIAETFSYKDANGNLIEDTTKNRGGGVTLHPSESKNGNYQIFVHPDAGAVATHVVRGIWDLTGGKGSLVSNNEMIDAHEFGHISDIWQPRVESTDPKLRKPRSYSLVFENAIRSRYPSPLRRIRH